MLSSGQTVTSQLNQVHLTQDHLHTSTQNELKKENTIMAFAQSLLNTLENKILLSSTAYSACACLQKADVEGWHKRWLNACW